MKPGEVFLVKRNPTASDTQKRPYVIVSIEEVNHNASTVVAVPLTTNLDNLSPVKVLVGIEGGLERESAALCYRITSVRKDWLEQKLGQLSPTVYQRIVAGILATLGQFIPPPNLS